MSAAGANKRDGQSRVRAIVAKRLPEPYLAGERAWPKVKNRAYWRYDLEREGAFRARERAHFNAIAKAFGEGGLRGFFPRSLLLALGCEEEGLTRSATGLVLHLRHLLGAGSEAAHPWGEQRRLPSIRGALFARRQS